MTGWGCVLDLILNVIGQLGLKEYILNVEEYILLGKVHYTDINKTDLPTL